MKDHRKYTPSGSREQAIRTARLARRYVAAVLVAAICALPVPAAAADQPGATSLRAELMAKIAFAPRTDQPQTPSAQPAGAPVASPAQNGRSSTVSGGRKWGGIVMMAVGGAMIARGALLQDPCDNFGRGFVCTSNYQEVRTASFVVGGGLAAGGLVLFSTRHRK